MAAGRDGHFEFAALPAGKYGLFTSVRSHQLQEKRSSIETPLTPYANGPFVFQLD
jgi:hypothetical protein